jgi:hypothetical protein
MSPSVELSATTFTRLQAHAVPLVDSIESVINRLIDFFESSDGAPVPAKAGEPDNVRQFNPSAPPSLTHTKVLAIDFGGRPLERGQVNWNGLLNVAIREAKAASKSVAEFKKLVVVNFVDGQKNDEGYRYLPDLKLSVQGQDANGAWKAACHIAQQLGRELTATFVWREKEGAAFPGVTGRFSVAKR